MAGHPQTGSIYSHSAGIIGVDANATEGFVVSHSLVAWPNAAGPYNGFPDPIMQRLSSTIMCFSMKVTNIDAIAATFAVNPPKASRRKPRVHLMLLSIVGHCREHRAALLCDPPLHRVYYAYCMVYRVVCTVWCVPCGVYRVVCTVWCVPCGVYRVVCTVWCHWCASYASLGSQCGRGTACARPPLTL
jgi:hypothetical protein